MLAVDEALETWKVRQRIIAMALDTTSSNNGKYMGAAGLLEKSIGRKLFYLACRHHILELIAAAF